MKVIETALDGVLVIEPKVFRDDRGFFLETYNAGRLAEQGFEERFVQDNHSLSSRDTLRGLHAQRHSPQGKLVRVTEGSVFDVAVDLRLDSPTYRHWLGVELTAGNFLQLWIPPGFAHGFVVTSEVAQVQYKCTALYDPDDEITVRWDDDSLGSDGGGIDWPLDGRDPVLSPRDAVAPLLSEIEDRLREAPAYRLS